MNSLVICFKKKKKNKAPISKTVFKAATMSECQKNQPTNKKKVKARSAGAAGPD